MGELARESAPDLRALFLAYEATKGCGCCEAMEHGEAGRRLAEALGIPVDDLGLIDEAPPDELMAELRAAYERRRHE